MLTWRYMSPIFFTTLTQPHGYQNHHFSHQHFHVANDVTRNAMSLNMTMSAWRKMGEMGGMNHHVNPLLTALVLETKITTILTLGDRIETFYNLVTQIEISE